MGPDGHAGPESAARDLPLHALVEGSIISHSSGLSAKYLPSGGPSVR